MKPTEFMKKWKEGMMNLTPLQQTRAKATGHLWGSIGLSIAFLGMIYRLITAFSLVQLGFAIFIFFLIYMQINEYIGTKQKIVIIENIDTQIKEKEILAKL